MSEPQKKTIPKFKKKLQGFLSDESGKITKEDVLKMGMVAMGVGGMVGGVGHVEAGVTNSSTPGLPYPYAADGHNHNNGWIYGDTLTSVGGISCGHISGVVNGHLSGVPSASYGQGYTLISHGSHSSHGSHAQW